jgi:hypothetical protein
MNAGYHGHSIQEPASTMSSSVGSPMSMQEFSPLDAFAPMSPYVGQQMSSGYMTMPLVHNATPPPATDINYAHVNPLERVEQKLDPSSQYSAYNISSESYSYSEYVHEDDNQTVINHDLPRETTMSPDYAHGMSIYQQDLANLCS